MNVVKIISDIIYFFIGKYFDSGLIDAKRDIEFSQLKKRFLDSEGSGVVTNIQELRERKSRLKK